MKNRRYLRAEKHCGFTGMLEKRVWKKADRIFVCPLF